MQRFALIIVWLVFVAAQNISFVEAQTFEASNPVPATQIKYNDTELASFGFTKQDLNEYTKRLETIEGKWWGHLSPMEMMMYSAKTENERRRFAKMYLTTNNPKAQAERKSAMAMYAAAREIIADELSSSISKDQATILFVNANCTDCDDEVKAVVNEAKSKVDIYVTDLRPGSDISHQLVNWASALALPHQKVTLNDDKGIYRRSYGHVLSRIKVVSE